MKTLKQFQDEVLSIESRSAQRFKGAFFECFRLTLGISDEDFEHKVFIKAFIKLYREWFIQKDPLY